MSHIFIICVVVLLNWNVAAADKESQPKAVNVDYHVWYHPESPELGDAERVTVSVQGQSKFIKVMDAAAATDSKFRYEFTQFPFGKYITSIGGLKEDVPNKVHWMIYILDSPPTSSSGIEDEQLSKLGVDELTVEEGKSYLFWRKVVNY